MEDPGYDYYCQGIAALEQGNLVVALERFEHSLSVERHFKTLARISQVLEMQGKPVEAAKALQQAYELNPKNEKVAVSFAENLDRGGNRAEARRIVEEVLRRTPSYGPAKRLLAKWSSEDKSGKP